MYFLGECSEMICFLATLAKFLPSSVKNNNWKWLQMMVSDHYLKKDPHNPIQTCGVHLLGECSELIHFWATLSRFWPSGGHLCISIISDVMPGAAVGTYFLWCLVSTENLQINLAQIWVV